MCCSTMASRLLLFLALPLCALGYIPDHWYLKDLCGQTKPFSRDVVLSYYRYYTSIPKNYDCHVVLSTTAPRHFLQVRFMDIKLDSVCSRARVNITSNGVVLTPRSGVCGIRRPSTLYRSTGSTVRVALQTDSSINNKGSFEVLVTSFYYANYTGCRGSDFHCDNGICISNTLTCNGYNDCGDSSDEIDGCAGLAAGIIVGIVIAILFFIAFVVIFGICFRRRRRTYITIRETAQPYGAVNVSTSYAPSYAAQYN